MPSFSAAVLTPTTAVPSTPPRPTDTRLDAAIARVLQADDVPAFSRTMQELMTAVSRDDSSAQRLANIVLRDYALTVKVLRVANAAHYNRSGRAVQSATHALMLLGARTVRDLASALLLFEHYQRRSPGLKELMLLSLLTASTARAAAERCGSSVDPDAAHLAGMFRNLGEVLAAAHLGDEYAAALRAVPATIGAPGAPRSAASLTLARATAARTALGCSYEEIGTTVARHWGMPDSVRLGMSATGAVGEDLAAVCTAFAHDLTLAIHRADPTFAPAELARLLAVYGARLHLTRDSLKQLADRAIEETREVFAAAGVRLDDLRLARQVAAALVSGRESQAASEAGARVPGPGASGTGVPGAAATAITTATCEASTLPADDPLTIPELRTRLAPELAAAAADLDGYDVSRVLLLTLEAVLRGGPFDRACFHAADPVTAEFRPRTGLGAGIEKLLASPGVPFDAERGPAGPALRRGEEVQLLHGIRLTLTESQLLRRWDAVSAALFPVRVGGAVIGCVHADRHTVFAAPEASTTQYVRDLVRTLEHALEARRAASAGAPAPPAPALPAGDTGASLAMSIKMDAVLRLLRGEPLDVVAGSVGVSAAVLDGWRAEFLAGAAARLAGG